jgi:acetyl esterase/lipase
MVAAEGEGPSLQHPRLIRLAAAFALALTCATAAGAADPPMTDKLMTWPELLSRPQPKPVPKRIAYGADPLQYAELWLPEGPGPFPVAVMVHGGCWTTAVAKAQIMAWAADDLRKRGIAVWNIEYRGVDRPGGGYPGTFYDVETAADSLRGQAQANHLDLSRVVTIGHSAGGHLAFWLVARPGLPGASVLRTPEPLKIKGSISLGGLPDLAAARAAGDASCGVEAVDKLAGAPRANAYADTSPSEMPAPAGPQVVINGERDPIAPPAMGRAYVAKLKAKGGAIREEVVPMGHAELIAPGTAAWSRAVAAVEELLR